MNDLFGAGGNGKRAKPTAAPANTDYSAKDIEVLEGLEPVRRGPALVLAAMPTGHRAGCMVSVHPW